MRTLFACRIGDHTATEKSDTDPHGVLGFNTAMKYLISAVALILAGCSVSSSEVIPAGKDSYLVSGSAYGGIEAGKSLPAAMKTANAYCTKQGKFMVIRREESGGNAGFGGERANLIFSCVTADDPEYKRPDLHTDPTTVIEDTRAH